MRKLLSADLWIDTSGAPVLPQIPASRDEPADFSWLQCFNALIGHNATRKARYALWAMACSDPDCRDQVKSPVCVHGLYAIHRHITLGLEPCVRCSDHKMYFPPPATTQSVLPSISSVSLGSVGTDAIPAPTITDAERLLDLAASSASIALYLPTFSIGADLAMASGGNWLSEADRRDLDSANNTLHRFAMKQERGLLMSRRASSFACSQTSSHRLQTAAEVFHSHSAARGIESADPGSFGLLRRQVARLPGDAIADTDRATLIAHAAIEAGRRLAVCVTNLGVMFPNTGASGSSHAANLSAANAVAGDLVKDGDSIVGVVGCTISNADARAEVTSLGRRQCPHPGFINLNEESTSATELYDTGIDSESATDRSLHKKQCPDTHAATANASSASQGLLALARSWAGEPASSASASRLSPAAEELASESPSRTQHFVPVGASTGAASPAALPFPQASTGNHISDSDPERTSPCSIS